MPSRASTAAPSYAPPATEADHVTAAPPTLPPAPSAAAPAVSTTAAAAPRERATPRWLTVARWSGLAVIFGAVLELTCRIEDWVRYRTPIDSPYTSQTDLVMHGPAGAHGRPHARYQKWVMNGLGMRGPAATVARTPGVARVVTVGASETFGLYESPGREYPRQLEDTLNARFGASCPAAPARAEVLNAALPGMSLPTVVQDVQLRLGKLRPDVVAMYPTPVQYLDVRAPAPLRPDSSGRAHDIDGTRALHPRALDRLREQVKLMLPGPVMTWLRERDTEARVRREPPGWRFTAVPAERLAQYEHDLRGAIGAVRAAGAVPVVATHANRFMGAGADSALLAAWGRFYPRATPATIVAFDSMAREVTLRVASDSGVTVADVGGVVGTAPGRVFQDYSHFTDAGSALVASTFAQAIAGAVPACRDADRP